MKTDKEIEELAFSWAEEELSLSDIYSYDQKTIARSNAMDGFEAGYKACQNELKLADQLQSVLYTDLMDAYKNAKNNEECAKILRLVLTDFKEFAILYGHSYEAWIERYSREREQEKNNGL